MYLNDAFESLIVIHHESGITKLLTDLFIYPFYGGYRSLLQSRHSAMDVSIRVIRTFRSGVT